jgi:hypothetical protein
LITDAICENCKSVNEKRNKPRANMPKSLEPKQKNAENAKFL